MGGRGSSPSDGMGSAAHPVPANAEITEERVRLREAGSQIYFCTQAKSFAGETSPNSSKVGELS